MWSPPWAGVIPVGTIVPTPGSSQMERDAELRKSLEEMRSVMEGMQLVRREIENNFYILLNQVPRDTRYIIQNVEVAMIKVLKIAVAVRGDYKTNWNDDAPVRKLINDAKLHFDAIESDAKASLERITKTQSTIVDLQTNKLGSFKDRLEKVAAIVKTYNEGTEKQYNTMKATIDSLERTQEENQESVRVLQEKLQDYARRRLMVESTMLISPVAYLIAKGIDEGIVKTRQTYNSVREAVDRSKATIRVMQSQISDLSAQRSQLKAHNYALQDIQTHLPSIVRELKDAQLQASMYQSTMTTLQTKGTTLGRQVMAIVPPIGTTNELAYTKDQIVLGLMQVADTAMFDPQLEDECYFVADELQAGYRTKTLPEDAGKIFDGLKKRISRFSPDSGIIPYNYEAFEVLQN